MLDWSRFGFGLGLVLDWRGLAPSLLINCLKICSYLISLVYYPIYLIEIKKSSGQPQTRVLLEKDGSLLILVLRNKGKDFRGKSVNGAALGKKRTFRNKNTMFCYNAIFHGGCHRV